MATVRHWPSGQSHDHSGASLREATRTALECEANTTVPDSALGPVVVKLQAKGKTSFAGRWFEVVSR
jgi:hypothetical protein